PSSRITQSWLPRLSSADLWWSAAPATSALTLWCGSICELARGLWSAWALSWSARSRPGQRWLAILPGDWSRVLNGEPLHESCRCHHSLLQIRPLPQGLRGECAEPGRRGGTRTHHRRRLAGRNASSGRDSCAGLASPVSPARVQLGTHRDLQRGPGV